MKYYLISILILFASCYRNETCKHLYVGEYKIDTSIISNPKCLNYVKLYKWDTVKLVSKEDGKYFFETNDTKLKECEGEWWVNSTNIDGDCIGHIKQNNLEGSVSVSPFYIAIIISGEGFSLPFKKIDSGGKFVGSNKFSKQTKISKH
jgi:hypothetical protein